MKARFTSSRIAIGYLVAKNTNSIAHTGLTTTSSWYGDRPKMQLAATISSNVVLSK